MTEEKKPKQVLGHCPECGPGRYADVLCEHGKHRSDGHVEAHTNYRILSCGGCKTVYFQKVGTFSEDYSHVFDPETGEETIEYDETITYWPAPSKRKKPEWFTPFTGIDAALYGLLEETYNALDVDAVVLAATGVRTVFDRASELLKIEPAISFKEKLAALEASGKIGSAESDHLDVLTDAGGAAAHRGWKPTHDQLATIMSIVEHFIYRNFVLDAQVRRLRKEIPPKQKRTKKRATKLLPPPSK